MCQAGTTLLFQALLGRQGKGIELEFMASPVREDHWSAFRCRRMDLGPRLMKIISSLPAGKPPIVQGAHLLVRRNNTASQVPAVDRT